LSVLPTLRTTLCMAVLAWVATCPLAASADVSGAIPALPSGPYAVGCNDLQQDFSRVAIGDTAQDHWEGVPDGNIPRYITDLLSDAGNTRLFLLQVPDDQELYGRYAGSAWSFAMLICYPTTAANPRPDYPLPTGQAIPHMQTSGDGPIFADAATAYPILLFSHGLTGSPLSGDYIDAVKLLASNGYVVVAPFHGDPRFANVKLDGFGDYVYALAHIKDFVAMQAVRALTLSLALDTLLANPNYVGHVDPAKVGGFGASLGGESLLLVAGAALTTTVGLSSKQVMFDPRLKAAAGYVPYFGQDLFPAFGRDQKGMTGVTLPFIAISGTADTTAPIGATEKGFDYLTGSRQLVALTGVTHGFNAAFSDDIFTWSLRFLAGQLSGDPVARATSARMTSVAGGGDDVLKTDYIAPLPAVPDERIAFEFYNEARDHYFITTELAEAAMLDAGVVVPGWQRTLFNFKVRPAGDARGDPACRFYGTPFISHNAHFYTINAAECAIVKADPTWLYEGIAFAAEAPVAGDCPANRVPVMRLYNNQGTGEVSHRYVTSHSEVRELGQRGWIVEGNVFCAIP
jgi:predicted dienelactone hydrolase